ncbi:MAG TPA: diacylglycerol kinase family protein [Leptolinea sp.]
MSKKNKPIRAKLIANPGAGNVLEAASRLEQVTHFLLQDGLKVDVALAHPKKEAIPIVRKAVRDGYDIVIAMGGDGTIGAIIRGIGNSKIKLGIIPAGTENDIAASLGIPEDLKEACALIASGHTRKLDLGQISTKKRKKFNFLMVAAIGLTATLYPLISEVPDGKLAGLKDAIISILKYKTKPTVFLTLDDESKIEVETMLVTVANTPVTGVRNLVAPDAVLDDGLLDIAVYPDFSKAELLSYFLKSANEASTPDGRIQRYRAHKIQIKTSPKLDIAAEGIIVGKGTAWIKVLPGALRVIAPEQGKGAEKPEEKAIKELPEPVSPVSK